MDNANVINNANNISDSISFLRQRNPGVPERQIAEMLIRSLTAGSVKKGGLVTGLSRSYA